MVWTVKNRHDFTEWAQASCYFIDRRYPTLERALIDLELGFELLPHFTFKLLLTFHLLLQLHAALIAPVALAVILVGVSFAHEPFAFFSLIVFVALKELHAEGVARLRLFVLLCLLVARLDYHLHVWERILLFSLLVRAAVLLMLQPRILPLLLDPLTMDSPVLCRVSLAVSGRGAGLLLAVVHQIGLFFTRATGQLV